MRPDGKTGRAARCGLAARTAGWQYDCTTAAERRPIGAEHDGYPSALYPSPSP